MELAIIHNGQVFTFEEKLEEYDFTSNFARIVIMESLALEVARILKHEDQS